MQLEKKSSKVALNASRPFTCIDNLVEMKHKNRCFCYSYFIHMSFWFHLFINFTHHEFICVGRKVPFLGPFLCVYSYGSHLLNDVKCLLVITDYFSVFNSIG